MGELVSIHAPIKIAPTNGDPWRPLVELDILPLGLWTAPARAWVVDETCAPGQWLALQDGMILRGSQGAILFVAEDLGAALSRCHEAMTLLARLEEERDANHVP